MTEKARSSRLVDFCLSPKADVLGKSKTSLMLKGDEVIRSMPRFQEKFLRLIIKEPVP